MIRNLLVIFFIGIVVCIGASFAAATLGGPHHHGGRHNFGKHGFDWTIDDDEADNGAAISRDIAGTAGDRLELNIPAEINYTQGSVAKITATGPERWVNEIETQGNAVVFKDKHWSHHGHGRIVLTITAPNVRKFQVNGAAKLDIANYEQDDLSLQVNGAAKVDVAGAAKTLTLEMNGASEGDLRHLVNQNADVQINGAGQATLATTEKVDIQINGVGNAHLINKPKSLSKSVHGFGSVDVGDSEGDSDDGDKAKAATSPPPLKAKAPAKAV